VDEVWVIILNWNGIRDTLECLDSLTAQDGVSLQCIVVDNGSRDNSVQQIRARFPQVHILENERNLGFPGGNNAGIRYALERNAKFILILNNDTIVKSGMIRALFDHLTPEIGAAAPAIFYASQPDLIWSIGGMIHPLLLEIAKIPSDRTALPPGPVERDFITGCAMLVRAEVLRQVGLFDESFFPGYYEDLDLSLRIRRGGYRMLLVPQAHLLHKVSQASGGQFSPRVFFLMARNSGFYFRKHMRLWQAPFVLGYRFLSAVKTTVRLAYQKNWPCLKAYWTGLACGWTGAALKSGEQYLSHYRQIG
jgi:GT2 family glycosyltransferase